MINIQTKMKIHRSLHSKSIYLKKNLYIYIMDTHHTHTHKCLASSQMILMEEKKKISSTTTTMIINGNMLMMMIMMIVVGKIPEKNFAILFTPHMWLFFFSVILHYPTFFFFSLLFISNYQYTIHFHVPFSFCCCLISCATRT